MTLALKTWNGITRANVKTFNGIASAALKTLNGIDAAAAATDPYWSSVVLLVGNDNAGDGTTTFTDQSTSAKTITGVGNIQYDTAQAPTGMTSALLLDGTGDYLELADSADWNFGTGDFTIEGFLRTTTVLGTSIVAGQLDGGSNLDNAWLIERDLGVLNFYYSATGVGWTTIPVIGTIAADTWAFFSVSRTGNTLECYVDSTRGSSTDASTMTFRNSAKTVRIGQNNGGTAFNFNGHVVSCRVTKGVGRYTGATITPPTLSMPIS